MSEQETKSHAGRPGAVLIGFLVLLIGEFIILSQAGIGLPEILPKPISTYAKSIDNLFYLILAVTGFFFLLTEGLLIYFLVRFRAKPGGKPRHTHGHHGLEMAWTLIPGTILFLLAVLQTGVWGDVKYKSQMPKEEDCLVVQVLGKQFEWHFRYAGPDGEFGTNDDVGSRHLHVPVDTDVMVKLHTIDVLHSFWLPNARLKQDLLPGKTIPQWFNLTELGKYEVVCAELCGQGHTKMKSNLFVQTQEEFDAWIARKYEEQGNEFNLEEDPNLEVWRHWPMGEKKQ